MTTARNVVLIVIAVVWLVIIGWLTVWPFLNWWTTHFVITDRRVMFRHGLLTRSGIDIPLARINSVELSQDLHGFPFELLTEFGIVFLVYLASLKIKIEITDCSIQHLFLEQ